MDIQPFKRGEFLFVNKELDELLSKLNQNEHLRMVISGQSNSRAGLLVLTDIRIFWYAKRMFGGSDFQEVPLAKIGGASVSRSGITNKLKVTYTGGSIEVSVSSNAVATEFAAAIQTPISVQPITVPQNETSDIISKLERLAALKEKGILTDAEFAAQKSALLNAL